MRAHAPHLLSVAALLSACTQPPPPARPTHTGWTESAAGDSSATVSPATAVPTFALGEELGNLVEVARIEASGHPGRPGPARVLASPSLGPYPALGPGRPVPAGAIVVEAFSAPKGGPTAFYGMQRRADGGWAFAVADERGAAQPVNLAQCVRCHADAPNQGLFGPPKAP